ncbi:MAG TPA: radical SAM protein [Spirochaetia bacterium]|nr:radical SAM protein [Spirochaetia bacterium]
MNISVISVSGRLSTDGSRLISALLKRDGHQVRSVFMSRREPMRYDPRELELLDPVLGPSGMVLVSVYSSYEKRARQLTDFIHERYPGKKVFWGGPHCISVPDMGLRHADGICYSEGDEAVLELARRIERGEDWTSTPNFAVRVDGRRTVNPVLPPFSDLDSLPFYDYELAGHYLLDRELVPMTRELLKSRLASFPFRAPTFFFMTSRGCPHNCSYCNNCRYLSLWGKVPIRLHSVERVITELERQLADLGFVEYLAFGDDDFFVRPQAQIEEFAEKYRRRVGLPYVIAVSARTYRREKLEPLLDAGLRMVQMGVQSGSQRVLDEVFNRNLSVERTRAAAADMARFGRPRNLDLGLDFIIDNPWETREDVAQTFRYIQDLPWWVQLNVFYLAYFPGTPLYDRAVAEGVIRSSSREAFRFWARTALRYQRNWETFLIILTRFLRLAVRKRSSALQAFLRACGSRPVRVFMTAVPGGVFSAMAAGIQRIVLSQARRKESRNLTSRKPAPR